MRKNRRLPLLLALLAVPLFGAGPGVCACSAAGAGAGAAAGLAASGGHDCCVPAPAARPACHASATGAGDDRAAADAFRAPRCRCGAPASPPVEAAISNTTSFPSPGAKAHPGSTSVPVSPQAAQPALSPLGSPDWTRSLGWLAPSPGGGNSRSHLALHVIRI